MDSTTANRGWRIVDIVVAAVIGVAFGVIFAAWNVLWGATSPLFTAFPPAQALIYGMWLVPGVLGGVLIRKPGAAVFTEVVAAAVSMVVYPGVGLVIIAYGLGQGLAAEAVFGALRYRRWTFPVVVLAGAVCGLVPAIADNLLYNVAWAMSWQVSYAAIVIASSTAFAGVGSFVLFRALARTGVLSPFASGREQVSDRT